MDAEIRAKWVAALRSGKYEQGRARLRDGDAFCCLGVLCDLVDPGRWDTAYPDDIRYDGMRSYMPGTVHTKVGLDYDASDELVRMNDGGKRFETIADYIEKNL